MFPISSDRYKQWEIYASMFIGKAKAGKPVIDFPINLCVKFYFNDHQHEPDLSNLYQGLEDVLQKMNVIKNDKLIYSHDGSKKLFDDTKERIEITITKAC